MKKEISTTTRKKKFAKKDLGVYINLLTDFGFKRIFGIKEVMIKFLNSALEIEGGIVDLQYGNPEKLGFTKDERKAVYDLYCVTGKEEHIIVEIQCVPQVFFIDRTILYISRLINSLSEKGKKWNYELPKVYSVNILDFTFQEAMIPLGKEIKRQDENKYVSRVQLYDCDTKEVFYDKLTMVYIELPNFNKELNNLKTFFEQWIYIIKHLHELNDLPEKFRKEKVFEILFETAKIARMTTKEYNNYIKELNNMNIVRNEIRTRDNIIAAERNAFAAERNAFQNTLAEKDRVIAEYIKKFGAISSN